jgi:hypothetical protein
MEGESTLDSALSALQNRLDEGGLLPFTFLLFDNRRGAILLRGSMIDGFSSVRQNLGRLTILSCFRD